ncbi:PREDICTED: DNA replication factor Cdt1 [Gekko japonicus]|uniref:DNA replication factor Cdt1 n=1 Tax=Gekko japonicus TaxID=146911 RepID=A0ABM1KGL2_GEKJA|nr:PREDICTED: DNA replication factor Cdt1 [Gekko japonicus]
MSAACANCACGRPPYLQHQQQRALEVPPSATVHAGTGRPVQISGFLAALPPVHFSAKPGLPPLEASLPAPRGTGPAEGPRAEPSRSTPLCPKPQRRQWKGFRRAGDAAPLRRPRRPGPPREGAGLERFPRNLDKKAKELVNVILSPGQKQERGAQPEKDLARETLAQLRCRLEKLTQKGQVPAGTSEAKGDVKSRLQRARLLETKICARKTAEEEKDRLSQLPLATQDPKPEAEGSEKVPAYQRFHTLAQDVPPGLTLPYKYRLLAEMFRSMETIVGMLFNRSETVTFAKVKQGVQDMMRNMETIVGMLFNRSETVTFAKVKQGVQDMMRKEVGIAVNGALAPAEISWRLLRGKRDKSLFLVSGEKLSASHLLERQKVFNRNLVNVVKEHHKAFLASLNPPMAIPDDKLARWHPRFKVDEVPDIVPAELPRAPQVDKLTTAQEVLAKARTMLTPKMEKALANLALRTAEASPSVPEPPRSAPPSPAPTPSSLKGVSQSLLERVRAKEAQKLQALMTRDPLQERRLERLARLPEMARILRNVFVAEKKQALTMEVACQRMTESYRGLLMPGEMEKHLRLFSELLPDWVSVLPVRTETYVKLDKSRDLNVITERLTARVKEEKQP